MVNLHHHTANWAEKENNLDDQGQRTITTPHHTFIADKTGLESHRLPHSSIQTCPCVVSGTFCGTWDLLWLNVLPDAASHSSGWTLKYPSPQLLSHDWCIQGAPSFSILIFHDFSMTKQ